MCPERNPTQGNPCGHYKEWVCRVIVSRFYPDFIWIKFGYNQDKKRWTGPKIEESQKKSSKDHNNEEKVGPNRRFFFTSPLDSLFGKVHKE